MRPKDKDKNRRLARDEREARKKVIAKKRKCKHLKRKSIGQAMFKCCDCGSRILEIGRQVRNDSVVK